MLYIYTPGLKPGWVIRVAWIMFCLSQPGLTHFIKYTGLADPDLMASGSDQSDGLSMLDGDYESQTQLERTIIIMMETKLQ